MLNSEDVAKFKAFIELCQKQPSLLHLPELDFFRKYLIKLGAELPPVSTSSSSSDTKADSGPTAGASPEPRAPTPPPEVDSEPESPESEVELDNSGVIGEFLLVLRQV